MEKMPTESKVDPRKILCPPSRKAVAAIVHEEGPKEKDRLMKEEYAGEFVTLALDGSNFRDCDYYINMIYIPYKKNVFR
jgi:hypothetical protein